MRYSDLLLFALFAIVLFIVNGIIGKLITGQRISYISYAVFDFNEDGKNYSGNYFQCTVTPAVYVTIVCAIMQGRSDDWFIYHSYLVVPLYWLIRLLYYAVSNRIDTLNGKYEVISAGLSCLLAAMVTKFVIQPLYQRGSSIIIPLEDLRNAVWFAIIAYLCKLAWDMCKRLFDGERLYSSHKIGRVVEKRFIRLQNKYGSIVSAEAERLTKADFTFISLVYAVMLFEDYNRPKAVRFVERLFKRIIKDREMSTGVMQVQSTQALSDEESIKLGMAKLYESYLNDNVDKAISDYNSGDNYFSSVKQIYAIVDHFRRNEQFIKH